MYCHSRESGNPRVVGRERAASFSAAKRRGIVGFAVAEAGFTLIELSVVVVIIGILVAIGIPSYQNSRAKSEDAACRHNLRTVDGAIASYRATYPADATAITWAKLVPEFLKEIPVCPAKGVDTLGLDDRMHCSLADPGPPAKHMYVGP